MAGHIWSRPLLSLGPVIITFIREILSSICLLLCTIVNLVIITYDSVHLFSLLSLLQSFAKRIKHRLFYVVNRSNSGGVLAPPLKLDTPSFRHMLELRSSTIRICHNITQFQLSSYAGTTFVKSAIFPIFYLIKKFTFYKKSFKHRN